MEHRPVSVAFFSLCLAFTLLTCPIYAQAEWKYVSENPYSVEYIDLDTVVAEGDLRRIWEVGNSKNPRKDKYASLRQLKEYDCKNMRYRVLSFSTHSGELARGKVLYSNNEVGKWIYIAPETYASAALAGLCRR